MNSVGKVDEKTSKVPIVVEEEVLELCARGDRRAQNRLYTECYSFMMRICIRYVTSRDDAEDLLNRSFLKVLNGIAKRKKDVPFGLWLRRITINTVIDEFRKNKVRQSHTDVVDFSESATEYDTVSVNGYLEKMESEQVQALINQLPPMSRQVFNLYIMDGYNHKEIATMLGISEGTSKWHLNNARTRLKEQVHKLLPFIKSFAS